MAHLVALALLLFAGSCYGGSARIVGGYPTTIDRYPALVQVDFLNAWSGTWSQNCAGTILNEVYILSAAHCFEGSNYQPSQRRIRAGTTYRNYGGVLAYVSYDVKHPSYGMESRWDGDITVVRLSSYMALSPVIQQGYIIAQGGYVLDDTMLSVSGWGHVSPGGPFATELKQTTVITVNNYVCSKIYEELTPPAVVTSNMICAGVPGGGRDHCEGDAGAGLYYQTYVVGVVSWGYGCGYENFPGVSTAIASYSDWILSVAL